MTLPARRPLKVAFYLPHLHIGGAERVFLRLAEGLAATGVETCFVLDRGEGELLNQTRRPVHVLGARRTVAAVPKLRTWLKTARPDVPLSAISHNNIVAVLARAWAGVPTAIIVGEHSLLTHQLRKNWKFAALRPLIRFLYPRAAAVVTVSETGKRDVESVLASQTARVCVLPNPAVADDVATRTAAPVAHPWLAQNDGPPVVIAAGRLIPLKDFATVLKALAKIVAARPCRLVILGEGPERRSLETLRQGLGLDAHVDLPGAVMDPLPWFARAAVVVSSSLYEGFGLTLVEAMACGTPVVTTEAGGAPAELVSGLGPVVENGDADGLAAGIVSVLDAPPTRDALRARAAAFTTTASVEAYDKLVHDCAPHVEG